MCEHCISNLRWDQYPLDAQTLIGIVKIVRMDNETNAVYGEEAWTKAPLVVHRQPGVDSISSESCPSDLAVRADVVHSNGLFGRHRAASIASAIRKS